MEYTFRKELEDVETAFRLLKLLTLFHGLTILNCCFFGTMHAETLLDNKIDLFSCWLVIYDKLYWGIWMHKVAEHRENKTTNHT